MATSKSLQKPTIIGVIGSTIRIAHPDISKYTRTFLAAPIAAAGTAATFYDNENFVDDGWFLAGLPGESKTEENDVNGAVTRGQSVTVTNTFKFAHEIDTPITLLFERKIKIYGAATDGGAGTLIASIDAITGDAFSIQWANRYSEYTLISTDTAYAYYYAKFTDGTTDSDASDYVLAAGLGRTSVEELIQAGLEISDTRLDGTKFSRELLIKWANDCQDAITQFVYQDPLSGAYVKKDWSWENIENTSSLTTTQNQNAYALSGLTYALKYPQNEKGVQSVRIGVNEPLEFIDVDEMDRELEDKPKTATTATGSVAATTLTVTSTAEFATSGSITAGTLTLTYTAKTATQFTGIPASGTGSITAELASGSVVWQNNAPGEPDKYTIFSGSLIFNRGVSSTYASLPIKVRYLKALTRFTDASDTTEVPFTNVFQWFIGAKCHVRKGNIEKYNEFMAQFDKMVLANALADRVNTMEEDTYYTFFEDL